MKVMPAGVRAARFDLNQLTGVLVCEASQSTDILLPAMGSEASFQRNQQRSITILIIDVGDATFIIQTILNNSIAEVFQDILYWMLFRQDGLFQLSREYLAL